MLSNLSCYIYPDIFESQIIVIFESLHIHKGNYIILQKKVFNLIYEYFCQNNNMLYWYANSFTLSVILSRTMNDHLLTGQQIIKIWPIDFFMLGTTPMSLMIKINYLNEILSKKCCPNFPIYRQCCGEHCMWAPTRKIFSSMGSWSRLQLVH